MSKRGWLGQSIEEAQKEMDTWPQWMKETAKYEGSIGESSADNSLEKETISTQQGAAEPRN